MNCKDAAALVANIIGQPPEDVFVSLVTDGDGHKHAVVNFEDSRQDFTAEELDAVAKILWKTDKA